MRCRCGGLAEEVPSQAGKVAAYFCRRCRSRYDASGVIIEAVPIVRAERDEQKKELFCKHPERAIDKVLDGAGKHIASVCRQCMDRFTVASCHTCGKPCEIDLKSRGRAFCGGTCRKEASRKKATMEVKPVEAEK